MEWKFNIGRVFYFFISLPFDMEINICIYISWKVPAYCAQI